MGRDNDGLFRTCSCVALSVCVYARAKCLMKAHETDMETDNRTRRRLAFLRV